MNPIFLLFLLLGEAYQSRNIRVDLEHAGPLILHMHPSFGCAISFSHPFEDGWAADAASGSNGAYYQYLNWGPEGSNYDKIIIKNIQVTREKVNFFLLFEDHIFEMMLIPTTNIEKADRRVNVNLVFPEAKMVKPRPNLKLEELKAEPEIRIVDGEKKKRTRYGDISYSFDGEPLFLHFKGRSNLPPLLNLEIVRGQKRWGSRRFKIEFPINPRERKEINPSEIYLEFDRFVLGPKESLYLRIQLQGERDPTFIQLKAPKVRGR